MLKKIKLYTAYMVVILVCLGLLALIGSLLIKAPAAVGVLAGVTAGCSVVGWAITYLSENA